MEELSKSQTAAGSTQNTRTYIQVEKNVKSRKQISR